MPIATLSKRNPDANLETKKKKLRRRPDDNPDGTGKQTTLLWVFMPRYSFGNPI